MGRLRKVPVEIPLVSGVREDMADQLMGPNGFTVMQNSYHDKTGRLAKRKGFEELRTNKVAGSGLGEVQKLATLGNELIAFEKDAVHTYVEETDEWALVGTHWTMRASEETIYRSKDKYVGTNGPNVTGAYANGHFLWIFEDDYIVQEETTGAIVASGTLTNAQSTTPFVRVMTCGNYIVAVYRTSTNAAHLIMMRWNMADPTDTPYASDGFITDYAGSGIETDFDAISYSALYFVVCYRESATNKIQAVGFDLNGSDRDGGVVSAATAEGPVCVSHWGNNFFVGYLDTGVATTVVASSFTFDGTTMTAVATATIDATGNAIRRLVGVMDSASTGMLFYQEDNGATTGGAQGTQDITRSTFAVTGLGSIVTAAFKLGVGLCGRPFTYNSEIFVPVVYSRDDIAVALAQQNTFFLMTDGGDIVARSLIGRAGVLGDAPDRHFWSDVIEISSTKFAYAAQEQAFIYELESGGSGIFEYIFGLSKVEYDFAETGNSANLGGRLFTADGFLAVYDKRQLVECGFHLYPESLSHATGGGTANGLSDGETYKWKVVYEWYDKLGNLYRSAPSYHTSRTQVGGDQHRLWIPYLKMTSRTDVLVRIFRTEGNGTIYYEEDVVANDNTLHGAYHDVGIISDGGIISHAKLYTTGGILDHIAPPPPRQIMAHASRLFLITGDDTIHYSKLWTKDYGVQFNDALLIRTDPIGGRIASLSSQDGQIIIAKERRLLRVYGDGPDDAGLSGTFSDPIFISSDCGCRYLNPMLSWGAGIMIPSHKGIWMLHRDFTTEYIGGPIEDQFDGSADMKQLILLQDAPEIWGYIGGSATTHIRYYIDDGVWATSLSTVATLISVATLWRGQMVFVDSRGPNIYTPDTSFTDVATHFVMKIKTGWLVPGNLFEYSRLWWIYLLGEYKSAHTIYIKVHYEDGTSETFSSALSADPAPFLFRMMPARQRGRAFKIEVYDDSQAGDGEGSIWTALGLEFGVSGKIRIPPAQTL